MADNDPTQNPEPGDPDVDFEPESDEPDIEELDEDEGDELDEGERRDGSQAGTGGSDDLPPVPRPINWRTLSSDDAEHEWLDLNEWVNWLRHEFALPAQIVPPMCTATVNSCGSCPRSTPGGWAATTPNKTPPAPSHS